MVVDCQGRSDHVFMYHVKADDRSHGIAKKVMLLGSYQSSMHLKFQTQICAMSVRQPFSLHPSDACVAMQVSVQYQVLRDKVPDSFYKLTNQTDQIRAYVFDVVRSTVPKMDLVRAVCQFCVPVWHARNAMQRTTQGPCILRCPGCCTPNEPTTDRTSLC